MAESKAERFFEMAKVIRSRKDWESVNGRSVAREFEVAGGVIDDLERRLDCAQRMEDSANRSCNQLDKEASNLEDERDRLLALLGRAEALLAYYGAPDSIQDDIREALAATKHGRGEVKPAPATSPLPWSNEPIERWSDGDAYFVALRLKDKDGREWWEYHIAILRCDEDAPPWIEDQHGNELDFLVDDIGWHMPLSALNPEPASATKQNKGGSAYVPRSTPRPKTGPLPGSVQEDRP